VVIGGGEDLLEKNKEVRLEGMSQLEQEADLPADHIKYRVLSYESSLHDVQGRLSGIVACDVYRLNALSEQGTVVLPQEIQKLATEYKKILENDETINALNRKRLKARDEIPISPIHKGNNGSLSATGDGMSESTATQRPKGN